MSDTAVSIDMPEKSRNGRKALKQKTPSTNEANILAQKLSQASLNPALSPMEADPSKENHDSLVTHISPKRGKAAAAAKSKTKQTKQQKQSFENDLQEMQEMLQKLKIEKEKTEELLKEKDEMLKTKEEELENKGKEQEKLQIELKKLQKMKEFRPIMTFPVVQKEQEKKEKKKGGNEKKRPSPPYILWCKDQWNEVKKENPEADFKDVSNILGVKWKTVTAEEKKPYEETYQAEKEAYLQVMQKEKRETEAMKLYEDEHKQKTAMELLEQYLQFKQEAEKETKKKTKKEKDPLKPKQPMSAFFVFSNERRSALLEENKNILEVAKIAGEEWKNMTDEQRKPYEEIAKKNKEKYMEEMEVYKKNKEEEADGIRKEEEEMMKLQKQEALQLLKKKEKTENIIKKTKEKRQKKKQNQSSDPNKPKKPASSYILFSKEARKTLMQEKQGINNSTLIAMISVKWKELSEEEKNGWNAKAAEAMGAYKKELEEYNKSNAAAAEENKE